MNLFFQIKKMISGLLFCSPKNNCSLMKLFYEKNSNEPSVKFIETEYNGRKTVNCMRVLDLIKCGKHFNDADMNKILTFLFEARRSLNLYRYSIAKINFLDANITITLNDKLIVNDSILSFNICDLVENDYGILGNILDTDLRMIFYYYNLLFIDSIAAEIQNAKKLIKKPFREGSNVIEMKRVINEKNNTISEL